MACICDLLFSLCHLFSYVPRLGQTISFCWFIHRLSLLLKRIVSFFNQCDTYFEESWHFAFILGALLTSFFNSVLWHGVHVQCKGKWCLSDSTMLQFLLNLSELWELEKPGLELFFPMAPEPSFEFLLPWHSQLTHICSLLSSCFHDTCTWLTSVVFCDVKCPSSNLHSTFRWQPELPLEYKFLQGYIHEEEIFICVICLASCLFSNNISENIFWTEE